jgi:hypothetical protein
MTVDKVRSGDHEVCREASDFFVYRFPRGRATGAHVQELAAIERDLWPAGGYLFNMTVLGDELVISPGALSETASIFRHSPPRTAAFVTRRFVLRTAMEFLTRMLRGLGLRMEAGFFQDEASARAWLANKREERARGQGSEARKTGRFSSRRSGRPPAPGSR